MRIKELDGLRGIASLVVLFHHSLLVIPGLAAAYFGLEVTGQIPQLLVYSPAHIFWAGTEAVYLFFVLSGIVLARMIYSEGFSWQKYYPSRVFRILAPTAIAVLIGALFVLATAFFQDQASPWLQGRNSQYPPSAFMSDLTLIAGTSGRISQLWSLQWELIFSLALPLVLLLKSSKLQWGIALQLLLVALGAFTNSAVLTYLPMFGIGAVLGLNWEKVVSFFKFSRVNSSLAFGLNTALLLIAIVLICAHWILQPMIHWDHLQSISVPAAIIGIVVLIGLSVVWKPLSRVFTSSIMTWLGAISFSLYLLHEPIVVFVAFVTNSSKIGLCISIVVSLVAAWLFYKFIEKPIHIKAQALLKK